MIVITKMKIFSKDGVFRITFIILTFYILLKTILPCIEKISKINLFANTYFVYVLFVKILISTNPFKTKNKFLVFVSEIPLSKTHFLKGKIPTFKNEPVLLVTLDIGNLLCQVKSKSQGFC